MKSAGCNEQNVIGFNMALFRLNGGSFHDWQQIALNSLARNVRRLAFTGDHFVNLVQKDNPGLFD